MDATPGAPPGCAAAHLQVLLLVLRCKMLAVVPATARSLNIKEACNPGRPQAYQLWHQQGSMYEWGVSWEAWGKGLEALPLLPCTSVAGERMAQGPRSKGGSWGRPRKAGRC